MEVLHHRRLGDRQHRGNQISGEGVPQRQRDAARDWRPDPEGTKTAQCRKWLNNLLKDGPKPSPDCNTAANLMGFDKSTVNRACQSLKVIRDSKTWRIEPKEQAEQGNVEFDHNQHNGEERITA